MDTAKNGRKEITKDEQNKIYEQLGIEQIPLFQETKDNANKALQEMLQMIGNTLNSLCTKPDVNTETYLKLYKTIVIMNNQAQLAIVDSTEFAYMMNQINSNKIKLLTETLAKTNTDVAKLNSILQEPRINEMAKILGNIEEKIKTNAKASVKATGDYLV